MDSLYWDAVERFRETGNVRILRGDSGEILPDVLATIEGPVIYWLDGHYSGKGTALAGNTQCPIIAELDAIIKRGNAEDIILIDDARLFGWRDGYPRIQTLKKITSPLRTHSLRIVEDIIAIAPIS
jgi:hypothetical protein